MLFLIMEVIAVLFVLRIVLELAVLFLGWVVNRLLDQ
jgi:hypothetical protein